MKLKSNLTKRYYFPIVEGSNFGIIQTAYRNINAFLNYFPKKGSRLIIKVASFEQRYSVWSGLPIYKRYGYVMETAAPEMLKDLIKMNKYLNRQYNRLDKYLEDKNYEKYLKLIELLQNKSKLFNLVFLIRKIPGWAKDYTPLKVKWLLEKIMTMNNKNATNLKVQRSFLKEYNLDGTVKKNRPLGVPKREWRVLSSQMEFTLVNFIKSRKWAKNQFACMPKVGAGDAWISIFKALLNVSGKGPIKNIIGYDLKQFFDTVSNLNIQNHLKLDKMPYRFTDRLYEINCTPPILKFETKGLEDERLKTIQLSSVYREFYKMFEMFGSPKDKGTGARGMYGIPQGLNTSPILACYLLDREKFYPTSRRAEVIQYVDDGLYLSRTGFRYSIKAFKDDLLSRFNISNGLELNEKKTEYIMKDRVWVKPMKFLGCEYDGTTFIARTRNGGKFVVHDAEKRLEEILGWLIRHKDLVGVYKQSFNKYIAEGWNKETKVFTSQAINLSDGDLREGTMDLWMSTKSTIEEISRNCVEFRNVEYLNITESKLVRSLNTMSMANAYYIAKFLKSPELQRQERIRYKSNLKNCPAFENISNNLLSNW